MSREEIGRVRRARRGCYEDASDLSSISRARRVRGYVENDTPHGQTGSTIDRRPTNQVSAWQAERGSRPTHPTRATRATSWSHPRRDAVRVGRVDEGSTRMLQGNCCRGI